MVWYFVYGVVFPSYKCHLSCHILFYSIFFQNYTLRAVDAEHCASDYCVRVHAILNMLRAQNIQGGGAPQVFSNSRYSVLLKYHITNFNVKHKTSSKYHPLLQGTIHFFKVPLFNETHNHLQSTTPLFQSTIPPF